MFQDYRKKFFLHSSLVFQLSPAYILHQFLGMSWAWRQVKTRKVYEIVFLYPSLSTPYSRDSNQADFARKLSLTFFGLDKLQD